VPFVGFYIKKGLSDVKKNSLPLYF